MQLPLTCSGGTNLRSDVLGHDNDKVKHLKELVTRNSGMCMYNSGERNADVNLWLMSV